MRLALSSLYPAEREEPMAKKRRKKTHFVPHSVLTAAFVGSSVVPLCVASCGGDDTTKSNETDARALGVAAPFDGSFSVAAPFDARAQDVSVADVFSVAAPFDADTDAHEAGDGSIDGPRDASGDG